MTIIRRIKRVAISGVFRDFVWTSEVADFCRYNLIYGLNGSGKTSLSNVFRCLEMKRCEVGEFSVETEIGEISSVSLENQVSVPQVRVFNRDFVINSIFTRDGTCSPIYFLGQESVSKNVTVEQKTSEKTNLEIERTQIQNNVDDNRKASDNINVSGAKEIKERLRSDDTRNDFHNYNKAKFTKKVAEFREAGRRPKSLLDADINRLVSMTKRPAKEEILPLI